KRRICAAGRQHVEEVTLLARAAGGDHRDRNGVGDAAGQLDVIPGPRAVAVHAGEQDLTRAPVLDFPRPLDGVQPGRDAPAAHHHLVEHAVPACVNADDDALASEAFRALGDQVGGAHGGAVDRGLVRSGEQRITDVLDGAQPAADAERDEDRVGDVPDHVEHGVAPLVRGADVEQDQLVRALGVKYLRVLGRVACIYKVDEIHALDDAPAVYIEAGDDALGEHRLTPRRAAGLLPPGSPR